MNRREFIVSAGAAGSIGIFSGCLGSGAGNNNSSNGSGNGGGGETTVDPATVIKRITYEKGNMFVHVGKMVRRVRLYDPNGQKYATKKVGKSETSAKITLIEEKTGGTYEGYNSGSWKARADRKTNGNYEELATADLSLEPNVKATSLRNTGSGNGRKTTLTLENTGNAPKAVTGARLSAKGHEPSNGTMSILDNPIIESGESVDVGVSYFGLHGQFPLKQDQKPGDVSDEYCTGQTVPATIEIQEPNGETRKETYQITFNGKPYRHSPNTAMCTNVSLQSNSTSNASSNSSTTNS